MLKYMFDTNIGIYIIKRRPLNALKYFNEHTTQLCISSITLAELYHGVEKSQYKKQNRDALEDFIPCLEVIDYTPVAAAHYGDIRANLKQKGKTIGVNDLHIAAHAG